MCKGIYMVRRLAVFIFVILIAGCSSLGDEKKADVDSESQLAYFKKYQIPNYEKMSVSDFNERIIKKIKENGENDFAEEMEKIQSKEDSAHKLYDTEDEMYYINNVLLPFSFEKMPDWQLDGNCVKGNVLIEYSIKYNILDAGKITMGEYNNSIKSIVSKIESLSEGEELSQSDFEKELENLSNELSNENFEINVDGIYKVEDHGGQSKNILDGKEGTQGEARDNFATKLDYEKMFALMSDGYEKKSVNDFLDQYVDSIQKDDFKKAMDAVYKDLYRDEIPDFVTKEQEDFLMITLEATSREFIGKYQDKSSSPQIQIRIEDKNKDFDFLMDYLISYNISDTDNLLIMERDERIKKIKNQIEDNIKGKNAEELSNQKLKIQELLEKLEKDFSTEKIIFTIDLVSYRVSMGP